MLINVNTATHPEAKPRSVREHDARFWFFHPISRNRCAIVNGNGETIIESVHALHAHRLVREHNQGVDDLLESAGVVG